MDRISLNRGWEVSLKETIGYRGALRLDVPFYLRHEGHFRMRKSFALPEGTRHFFAYEGIQGQCGVYLNGALQGEITETFSRGYLELKGPFKKGDNEIELIVSQSKGSLSPGMPFYLYIESSGPVHISYLYARGDDSGSLKIRYGADGPYEEKDVSFSLKRRGSLVATFKGREATISDIRLYRPKAPELYDLSIRIEAKGQIEEKSVRVGFYSTSSKNGHLFLAGRRQRFSGAGYDSLYPHVGAAMPFSPHYEDVLILRRRLGTDVALLHTFPPNNDFLKSADELGLLCLYDLNTLPNLETFLDFYGRHACLIGALVPLSYKKEEIERLRSLAPGCFLLGVDGYTEGLNGAFLSLSKIDSSPFKKLIRQFKKADIPFVLYDDRMEKAETGLDTLGLISISNEMGAMGEITGPAYGGPGALASGGRYLRIDGYAYASNRLDSPVLRVDDSFFDRPGGELLAYTNGDYLEVYKNDSLLDVFRAERKQYPYLSHPPVIIRDFVKADFALQGFNKKERIKLERLFNSMALIYPEKIGRLAMLPYKRLLRKHHVSEEMLEHLFLEAADPKKENSYLFITSRNGAPAVAKTFARSEKRTLYVDMYKDWLADMRTYDAARVHLRLVDGYGTTIKEDAPLELELLGPMKIRGEAPKALKKGETAFYLEGEYVGGPSIGSLKIRIGDLEHEEILRIS